MKSITSDSFDLWRRVVGWLYWEVMEDTWTEEDLIRFMARIYNAKLEALERKREGGYNGDFSGKYAARNVDCLGEYLE